MSDFKFNESETNLYLLKVPFSIDDKYIIDGANTTDIDRYFTNRGKNIGKVQLPKFELNIKYTLILKGELNNEFTNLIKNNYFNNVDNLNNLFNYAVFTTSTKYTKVEEIIPDNPNIINNLSNGKVFYFINGIKWVSACSIELDLTMDVLNTLNRNNKENLFFTFGNKSHITRYHHNRVTNLSGDNYTFKIDKLSEGISAPLYKVEDTIFNEYDENFYLVYKNSLDDSSLTNNVVDCYLTYGKLGESQTKNIYVTGQTRRFTKDNVGNQFIYLLSPFSFSLYDEITQETKNISVVTNNAYCEISLIGDLVRVRTDLLSTDANTFYYVAESVNFSNDVTYYYSSAMISHPPTRSNIEALPSGILATTSSLRPWYDINTINRTDSKLIKIIKIPYSPTSDVSIYEGRFEYDATKWRYDEDTKLLKLIDINTRFSRRLHTIIRGAEFPLLALNSKSPVALASATYEPKLSHSDFKYTKINYDSFNLIIYNELLRPYYLYENGYYIDVDFKTTSTINSRFIFQLVPYLGDIYDKAYTDYPYTLSIARNNELGLYNSSYINYIRNGFNYDVKNKDRSVSVQYGLGAVQILGAVGSAISSVYTGGFGVAGAISLGTGAVATLTHAINNQISQEMQIQQKLDTLKAQANEVQSSDDVDLLDVYNQNRLHTIKYNVSEEMQNLLYKLFYYTGYKSNIIDNITNYINTRYWFNFIECDLHLINVCKLIPKNIIEKFINLHKEGVTYFHYHTITNAEVDNGYNINQTLENWENELVNE